MPFPFFLILLPPPSLFKLTDLHDKIHTLAKYGIEINIQIEIQKAIYLCLWCQRVPKEEKKRIKNHFLLLFPLKPISYIIFYFLNSSLFLCSHYHHHPLQSDFFQTPTHVLENEKYNNQIARLMEL